MGQGAIFKRNSRGNLKAHGGDFFPLKLIKSLSCLGMHPSREHIGNYLEKLQDKMHQINKMVVQEQNLVSL